MSATWGHHCTADDVDLIEDGVAAMGWDRLGDLSLIDPEPAAFKAALEAAYPDVKSGPVPIWAGQLHRFVHEAKAGDIVVHREAHGGPVFIGQLSGDYFHAAGEHMSQRRPVEWIRTGFHRRDFSPCALYELGASLTWFRIRRHESVWRATLESALSVEV